MDRSSLGNEITITLADGTNELDSLNGDENTFVVDVSSEFDFMGLVMILLIQMILRL